MKDRIFAKTTALVVEHYQRHPSIDALSIRVQQHANPTPPTADVLAVNPNAEPTSNVLGADDAQAPTSEIDALMRANPPKSLAELDIICAKWVANHTQIAAKPEGRARRLPSMPLVEPPTPLRSATSAT